MWPDFHCCFHQCQSVQRIWGDLEIIYLLLTVINKFLLQSLLKWAVGSLSIKAKLLTMCQHFYSECVWFLTADDDTSRCNEDGPHYAAEYKHLHEECLVLFYSMRLYTATFLCRSPLPALHGS